MRGDRGLSCVCEEVCLSFSALRLSCRARLTCSDVSCADERTSSRFKAPLPYAAGQGQGGARSAAGIGLRMAEDLGTGCCVRRLYGSMLFI